MSASLYHRTQPGHGPARLVPGLVFILILILVLVLVLVLPIGRVRFPGRVERGGDRVG
jgi:hypothetical protein